MSTSKTLALVVLIISFLSCSKSSKSDSDKSLTSNSYITSDTLKIRGTHPKLLEYTTFIDQLDSSDVNSSGLAFVKFKEIFTGQSFGLCDSGFVIYQSLYDTLEIKLNEKFQNDSTNFEPLFNGGVVPQELKELNRKIISNGFRIVTNDDFINIQQDRAYVTRNFFPYLSETMKTYLNEMKLESSEGFALDGAIIISPKKHIDRLLWYEKFISENPEFINTENCKKYRKAYLSYLMSGYENTKMFDEIDSNKLTEYFSTAYTYLLSKYSDSETANLIKPYYEAIKQNQTSMANDIYKQYMIKGLIINLK